MVAQMLHSQVVTDKLTGLYKPRSFHTALRRELARSRRYQYPCALILLGLGGLEHDDDQGGRPMGDGRLDELAHLVQAIIRETDIAAGYNGEALALILPQTDDSQARTLAERLRNALRFQKFVIRGGQQVGPAPINMGLAAYPAHAQSVEELIQAACVALLHAGVSGEGPVCVWQEALSRNTLPVNLGSGAGVAIPISRDTRKIVVIIPAYNEARFIGSVVLEARRHAGTVIVVDDGSTDATAELARAAGATLVRHAHNRGKGAALNSGLCRARDLSPDVVIALDADGQHLPGEIMTLAAPVLEGKTDIAVGSRYLEKKSRVPLHRIWGHRVFGFITNRISGVSLTDSQCGFRAFSPRALRAISFNSDGFSVESEMQFLAHEHNLRMIEVPITIEYCDKPKRPVVAHGLLVLNGILQIVGQYRPLLFFGVPGVAILLFGLGWGMWVVDIYRTTRMLAVGYALISVALTVVGSLSLFAGVILHSVRGLLMDLLRPGGR